MLFTDEFSRFPRCMASLETLTPPSAAADNSEMPLRSESPCRLRFCTSDTDSQLPPRRPSRGDSWAALSLKSAPNLEPRPLGPQRFPVSLQLSTDCPWCRGPRPRAYVPLPVVLNRSGSTFLCKQVPLPLVLNLTPQHFPSRPPGAGWGAVLGAEGVNRTSRLWRFYTQRGGRGGVNTSGCRSLPVLRRAQTYCSVAHVLVKE